MSANVDGVSDRQGTDDSSEPSEQQQPISPDRILSVIGNEYRRAVLNSLRSASSGILKYDTLVERVADRVRDEDTARGSDDHRQRTRIALHHTHLPKLEATRIIDCDVETGHVQFAGGEFERQILTLIESYDAQE